MASKMKKLFGVNKALVIAALIASIPAYTLVYSETPAMIFCPGTSQIVVDKDFGEIETLDGKWTGSGYLQPEVRDTWKANITQIQYAEKGECAYYSQDMRSALVLHYLGFPSEYQLFDLHMGVGPQEVCDDYVAKGGYQTTPTEPQWGASPSGSLPCYYYKNPIR